MLWKSTCYLVVKHARYQDAMIVNAMIAEMAAYYKDQGSSLYDALLNMYVQHGLYKEKFSVTKKGKSGLKKSKP